MAKDTEIFLLQKCNKSSLRFSWVVQDIHFLTASNTRKVLVTCTIISISIIENFYLICTYCTYIPIYFIKSCQKFSIVTKFIKFAKKNIKFPKSQILKNCQKLPKSPILKISKIGNFQNF